jgi:hypothetical protein
MENCFDDKICDHSYIKERCPKGLRMWQVDLLFWGCPPPSNITHHKT